MHFVAKSWLLFNHEGYECGYRPTVVISINMYCSIKMSWLYSFKEFQKYQEELQTYSSTYGTLKTCLNIQYTNLKRAGLYILKRSELSKLFTVALFSRVSVTFEFKYFIFHVKVSLHQFYLFVHAITIVFTESIFYG